MNWTALVPLKPAGARKTRLSMQSTVAQRDALSERLFGHVVSVLRDSPAIGRIILLAQTAEPGWADDWIADTGLGLNAELTAARAALPSAALMIVHADLPLLAAADIAALARAGAQGCAVAPDRHGLGTNAIALMPDRPFRFAFGPDSLRRHRAQGSTVLVNREGLALDVDTPEDAAAAAAAQDCGTVMDKAIVGTFPAMKLIDRQE